MAQFNNVIVHPLLLLSIVDHYNREVKSNKDKRVVGVLLGDIHQGNVDVTNCYAVPFEENVRQGGIWFLDHLYHEKMYQMFKKVNVQEKIVGWYTTGTHFQQHDFEINELFRRYTDEPILVRVDTQQQDILPTEAYYVVQDVSKEGKPIKKWVYLNAKMEALEPEVIGIEHILRDLKDVQTSSLTYKVQQKYDSLNGMVQKILQIKNYLDKVLDGKLQSNNEIMNNIQEIVSLLPNLNSESTMKLFNSKNNDLTFMIYLCSLTRSVVALHTLIHNKITNGNQVQA